MMEPPQGGDMDVSTQPVPRVGVNIAQPRPSSGDRVGPNMVGNAIAPRRREVSVTAAPHSRRRRLLLPAGLVVIAGAVIWIVNPFASSPASTASSSYSTYTVKRQTISSQTQVSATLGYSGIYTVTVPAGTSTQNLMQAQQAVTADQAKVQSDES